MQFKKIAILQSNYIPWKGYFDMINMVDEFILYDEVQYTKNDWRNRNKVKTSQGVQWLSIATRQTNLRQKINETKVSDPKWNIKHWRTISQNYARAKHFRDYKDIFEELYISCDEVYLSEINYKFIVTICNILGITTKIRFSSEFELHKGQTEKLLGICKDCEADIYVSGPAAKDYFDTELAKKADIQVEWMDYSGYKEYQQLFPPFEQSVSILDLLFNEGKNATKFMKSFHE